VDRATVLVQVNRHLGIDIAASAQTAVKPIRAGRVERIATWGADWGGYVIVSHDNNTWLSLYGHLDVSSSLSQGSTVTTATTLGTVKDLDAAATGDIDHVHLGIRAVAYNSTDSISRKGFADCNWSDPKSWVSPLGYLSRPAGSILDDNAAARSGAWACSTGVDFYYGTGYRTLQGGSAGSATFSFPISTGGFYKVYARWTPHANRTTQAKFTLSQGAVSQVVTKSQRTFPRGGWEYLTRMSLATTSNLAVKVTNNSSSGYLVIDAILIERE
jgi:murein DD-endopeptidase MepM/ murein hydrolase activator NlpD